MKYYLFKSKIQTLCPKLASYCGKIKEKDTFK